MKRDWLNTLIREKQPLVLAGLGLFPLLLYLLLFAPIMQATSDLRHKIRADQSVLAWMQATNKQIHILEKEPKPIAASSSASLLSIIQNDINNQPLAKNVLQLQQGENDTIQMRLQKVSFDALMKWLLAICQQQGLMISQMTVTPNTTPGIVDAELKLQYTEPRS